jgi:hypothetical protein
MRPPASAGVQVREQRKESKSVREQHAKSRQKKEGKSHAKTGKTKAQEKKQKSKQKRKQYKEPKHQEKQANLREHHIAQQGNARGLKQRQSKNGAPKPNTHGASQQRDA